MKPSLRAIVWNDWPALACAMGIPIFAAICLAYPYVVGKPALAPFFASLSVVATLVLGAILCWRIVRVYSLFARGFVVPGNIHGVALAKDRGRVDFGYVVNGQPVYGWTPVHKTRRVLSLAAGQPVHLLVDPARPGMALVAELYT
jgi:hypothetical protein